MAYFKTNVLDNQIKALPTIATASGSVATFDTDMTENLVEVKCQIVAQQSGSGTPSPSNPRPITVYNQLNLTHIDGTSSLPYLQGITSGTYGFVDLGSITWYLGAQGYWYCQPSYLASGTTNFIFNNTNWTLKPDETSWANMTNGMVGVGGAQFRVKDTNYSTPSDFRSSVSGVYLVYEFSSIQTPTYTESDFNAMLTAFGIDGSLHNIPFGQTVAKGKLNVTTGVLEITHGVVDIGSLGWTYQSAQTRFYVAFPNAKAPINNQTKANIVCENYETVAFDGFVGANTMVALTTSNSLFIRDNTYTDATTFITAVSGVKLVYELATPTYIQLSATQITALLNENNIWCDTGDTSVKYILSVGKAIS